ncbi:MAG TPA: substrate-binding domain-containing protein [Thermoleophilaceae bacterium]|nr:substrate-binding domain-containing protein [Thermoleophilaceae bacterium]
MRSSYRAKYLLSAMLLVLMSMFAAACGDDEEGGGGGGGEQSAQGKTVGVIAPFANPFQTDIRRGAEEVARENGVEMIYLNYDADSEREFRYVQDMINRDVDAVIYGANDAEVSVAGFRRINNAGIPAVCFDTCVVPEQQQQLTEAFVTSDNKQLGNLAGKSAADWINENVDGTAQVGFVTCNTQSVCRERFDAQLEALKEADYEEVANQVAVESDKVLTTTEGILQGNQDLDVIVTNGLPQTEGGVAAINRLKRDTVLFGMDMTARIARDLLDRGGPLQAAVGQDGPAIGRTMMERAIEVLEGRKPERFLWEIPGTLYTKDDPEAVREFLATTSEE